MPNVARAVWVERQAALRRLFSEFAFGVPMSYYNNNFDGVLLNFEGVRLSSGVAEGGADTTAATSSASSPCLTSCLGRIGTSVPWRRRPRERRRGGHCGSSPAVAATADHAHSYRRQWRRKKRQRRRRHRRRRRRRHRRRRRRRRRVCLLVPTVCDFQGSELFLFYVATSVRWFEAHVWPLMLHHAEVLAAGRSPHLGPSASW